MYCFLTLFKCTFIFIRIKFVLYYLLNVRYVYEGYHLNFLLVIFILLVELSTYKEVIGNLSSIISHNINHLSVDNFPVGT